MTVSTVLVVGATGSIGREAMAAATEAGLAPRALVRDLGRAKRVLPADTDFAVGDITRADTLADAVREVDAIIFTHGSNAGDHQRVDYGAVANTFRALGRRRPRIALMSSIYVTRQGQGYGPVIDWKRRAEWLVRASGAPYTIVRPGWFDRVGSGDGRLVLEQGDTGDGGIGRDQLATVLVRSLLTDAAVGKTCELFARSGTASSDWAALFTPLDPDTGLDGAHDSARVPLDAEPAGVQRDMAAVRAVTE
ncbi:SDR family oxidoreductase [Streptomyces sp. NPDC002680]|uniref:SDR family oxidoreductase n=1 Tax=Streptomyces sp. NPDC002680 TaxID=3364659 RepID=UPI003679F3FE